MTKEELLQAIISALSADLSAHRNGALRAHEAATHEECIPDNKYDTTALEASYIAQGQANRAQDIRRAMDIYRTLSLKQFDDDSPIRLTALVEVEDGEGNVRRLFIGPEEGGMKIADGSEEIVIITPGSPLGRELLGKQTGDEVVVSDSTTYTIVSVS